jgi:hypothetical protein
MKSDGWRLAQPPADELDVLDVVAAGSVLDMVLMQAEFGSA